MKQIRFLFLLLVLILSSNAGAWTLVAPNLKGWASHNIVVYWNFSACHVDATEMQTRLDQAIAAWNSTSGSDITVTKAADEVTTTAAQFISGTATQTPLLVCSNTFGADNSVDADFIPAATRLSMPTGTIDYGGILLNAETGKAADLVNLSGDQIAVVLAHELGHVFGLGHSSVPNALMYYSVTTKTAPTITEDDLDGISFLYARNEFSGNMFGCGAVRPIHGEPGEQALVLGVLFLFAIMFSLRLGRVWIRSERLL